MFKFEMPIRLTTRSQGHLSNIFSLKGYFSCDLEKNFTLYWKHDKVILKTSRSVSNLL